MSEEQGEAVGDGEEQMQSLRTVLSGKLSDEVADPDGGCGGVCAGGDHPAARTRRQGQRDVAADADLSVGGPDLAAQAFRAGLVDELHLFLAPAVVGGGNQALPDKVRLGLELLDERRFGNGMVYLRYGTRT